MKRPRKDTSAGKLAKLGPAFNNEGTITAGNAPGVNDGAGALVLMSEERAEKEGKTPFAYILAHAEVAVEAKDFPKTPGLVINELLKKTGKSIEEIDLFEINEAFAAVALASGKIANIEPGKSECKRWCRSIRSPNRGKWCPHHHYADA